MTCQSHMSEATLLSLLRLRRTAVGWSGGIALVCLVLDFIARLNGSDHSVPLLVMASVCIGSVSSGPASSVPLEHPRPSTPATPSA